MVAAVHVMFLLDHIWPKRYLVPLDDFADDEGLGVAVELLHRHDLLDSKLTGLVDLDGRCGSSPDRGNCGCMITF